jgi:glycerophosphoryl diester phosphodiesterase
MQDVILIAHRGASGNGHAPENTLAAFQEAINIGVDCVECDVHCTKDDQIVVIHDSSLNRTTNMKGFIKEMTLSEIRNADAGSWFDQKFKEERIPTLKELLELTKGNVITVIEIKADNITDKVIRDVETSEAISEVVIQSFYPAAVKAVHEIKPEIPKALLVGGAIPIRRLTSILELIHNVSKIGASMLNLSSNIITPKLVKESHKRGISVWAWTVDDEIEMKKLEDMGVDGITSNYPARLKSTIGQA